jgi:hypothetical protein
MEAVSICNRWRPERHLQGLAIRRRGGSSLPPRCFDDLEWPRSHSSINAWEAFPTMTFVPVALQSSASTGRETPTSEEIRARAPSLEK